MTDSAPAPPANPVDWLRAVGTQQEQLLEQAIATMKDAGGSVPGVNDPATVERVGQFWRDGLQLWQRFLHPADAPSKDKRFKDESWSQPGFAAIRQAYEQASAALMASVAITE